MNKFTNVVSHDNLPEIGGFHLDQWSEFVFDHLDLRELIMMKRTCNAMCRYVSLGLRILDLEDSIFAKPIINKGIELPSHKSKQIERMANGEIKGKLIVKKRDPRVHICGMELSIWNQTIFNYLDFRELVNMKRVCKNFFGYISLRKRIRELEKVRFGGVPKSFRGRIGSYNRFQRDYTPKTVDAFLSKHKGKFIRVDKHSLCVFATKQDALVGYFKDYQCRDAKNREYYLGNNPHNMIGFKSKRKGKPKETVVYWIGIFIGDALDNSIIQGKIIRTLK